MNKTQLIDVIADKADLSKAQAKAALGIYPRLQLLSL